MTKFVPTPKPNIAKEAPVRWDVPRPNVRIDPVLLDLVGLRMAQIRQCAMGVEKHWLDLQARGVSAERLDQVHLWRESSFFNAKEKAALMLGEAIASDPTKPVLDQLLEEARRHFRREELISLLVAIMAVNDSNHFYFTPQDAPEEPTTGNPSEPLKPFQTKKLPPYWLKLVHRLAERGIIVK